MAILKITILKMAAILKIVILKMAVIYNL